MVSRGAGWFQKRLREAVWFHGSVYEFRKGGAGGFRKLGGFSRGCVASGWVVVSGSGLRRGLVVSGKSGVVPGKAAWSQEKLRGFRKGCVVSGGVVWFPARLWGFTKVCVAYDVGSLMVKGWFRCGFRFGLALVLGCFRFGLGCFRGCWFRVGLGLVYVRFRVGFRVV